jgi:hypothetical protein
MQWATHVCKTGYTENFEAGKGIKLPGSRTQEKRIKNILSRFKFLKIYYEFMYIVSELSFHIAGTCIIYTWSYTCHRARKFERMHYSNGF